MSVNYTYSDYNSEDEIEFYATEKTSTDGSRGRLIKLEIDRDSKVIYIPNIFLDPSLQKHGFGKQIIKEIHSIAAKHDYSLLLVHLVSSFYNSLVKRGAQVIDLDTLQITSATKLSN